MSHVSHVSIGLLLGLGSIGVKTARVCFARVVIGGLFQLPAFCSDICRPCRICKCNLNLGFALIMLLAHQDRGGTCCSVTEEGRPHLEIFCLCYSFLSEDISPAFWILHVPYGKVLNVLSSYTWEM